MGKKNKKVKGGWQRCYKGKLPHKRYLLVYDDNERVALIDGRGEHVWDQWLESAGGRIQWYIEVPKVPYENGWLWPKDSVGVVPLSATTA